MSGESRLSRAAATKGKKIPTPYTQGKPKPGGGAAKKISKRKI